MSFRPLPALVCLLLFLRPSVVQAQATITWGTPAAIAGASDVLTSGTFLAAASAFGASSAVNGVTFSSYAASTNITYTGNHANYGAGVSTGNMNYNNILNIGFHTNYGDTATVTLSGLTNGQLYRVQIWTPSWDFTWSTQFSAGNTVAMGNTASVPTYVVGSFTANGTSETITYSSTSGTYGLVGPVAVFAISAVPEPSTYAAWAGALALGWAWHRRRRPRG